MKRITARTLVPVLAVAACEDPLPPVSCGGGGTVETVIDHAVSETFCFEDPNEDLLTYQATSSNPGIATAFLSGTDITVTGIDEGSAQVSVTATDPGGLTGSVNWAVTVKYAADVTIASCTGERLGGNTVQAEIIGTVFANIGLSDVRVVGYVGNQRVGSDFLGSMRRGERVSYRVTGFVTVTSDTSCEVTVFGDVSGSVSGPNVIAAPATAEIRP